MRGREADRNRADAAGLIAIQVDGMSRPAFEVALSRGAMPVVAGLVRSGALTLDDWTPLLPPCTPASQAGILHGRNDGIPGFRWFEKETRTLLVANHAKDAAEIERRLSDGRGLLANGGASIGNLLSGDATFSHLTMATIEDGVERKSPPDDARYPLDPLSYLFIVVESVQELVAEIVQARRQRRENVRPRMRRGWRYAVERVITNVPLRILSTKLVIREIRQGRPIIYVDYTGYDEISHHCGPGREESLGAAAKIDRSIGRIVRAMEASPRRYRLVLLSDHGQSLGTPFRQGYGVTLEQLIARSMGEGATYHGASEAIEYDNGITRMLDHLLGRRIAAAVAGLLERRPGGNHHRASRVLDSRGAPVASPADAEVSDVVMCASGNLGLVYLTALPGLATKEQIDARYPGLLDELVRHPGIEFLVVRSADGLRAIGRDGIRDLDQGQVTGKDPLAKHGSRGIDGLCRIAGFANSGDIIAIGRFDPDTSEVVSFEELVGSHGGLGGPQGQPFIAHPGDLALNEGPLVGAADVHRQLRRWLADLGIAGRDE
ncbi:MAG TPA: alkaline phosphatase family protein [Candidatus Limnocylindrales bacterium]|nr:alkaline phosphatase family protein [Candidatus Limnocylindrales bacterium]